MIGRILGKVFSGDILGLLLIVAALRAFTFGVSSSLQNTDTKYFFWICLLAVLIALGLSKLKLKGLQALVGMTVLGTFGVWILGARLAAPLWDLGNAILQVIPQFISAIRSHIPIDTTAISDAWLVVTEASNALSGRVQLWLAGLDRSVTVNDSLVRNLVWTLIIWLISAWMGWFAGRRNAIAALLPSLLLLAALTSYSERRIETLWLMVFVLLLLMGIWNYKNHTTQWERKKVDYSDSIRYDVSQAVLLLSLTIGMIAFITPSVSWRDLRDLLRDRDQNEVADMLGVQQQQVAAQNARRQEPSLPRDHLLSGGYAQSEKIVMIIRTGELPPVVNPTISANPPRHYWRSVTYDRYVGAGWVTSSAFPQNVRANTPLIPGLLNGYKTLHLDVEVAQPEGKLFWSGILFSVDIPFRADWRLRPGSDLFADQAALLQADLFAAVSTAGAYQAESYIPSVSVEDLRAASADYPPDIGKYYLDLPASLPERVQRLAEEITRGKTNAYDKAKAIESYVRTYPYDLEVPAPPQGRDVADYFLFDLKRGYCDYYATAMVVLARAGGLPARFVSGYSSGSYDAANAEYVVRELNAHSWAEIYFPEIGWIEFEPTAAQPEIELAAKNEVIAPQQSNSAAQLLYRFRLVKAIYWASPVAVILFVYFLYFTLIERWWYLRLPPGTAIEKIYRRLYRMGRPLVGEPTRAETAYEFMHKLVRTINRIGERSHLRKLSLSTQHDLELLTDMYQDTLFSHHNIQKQHIRKALSTWKRLRLRLLLARIHVVARRAISPTKQPPRAIPEMISH